MKHFSTETYQMKRSILRYTEKISDGMKKDQRKFVGEMIYGILASGTCILSKIADVLMEAIQKKNTVERLSRKLLEREVEATERNYLQMVRETIDSTGAVFVDDSEVIKPYGKEFEALGIVRDGSAVVPKLEHGYHVTEVVGLTRESGQPISLYSHIHSSREKEFISVNNITFEALRRSFKIAPDVTYVFDRGYDMNDLFGFMHREKKKFIVRITEKRKLFWKGKWYKSTALRDSHKGKLKTNVMFNGIPTDCYISCLNVQITQSRRPLRLILVYGLHETPMMLVTNRTIQSKDDAIRVVRTYFSRWRIEEYFRFKKQHFGFENFRVRSLSAINTLNRFLTYAIGFLSMMSSKRDTSALKQAILRHAHPQREKVAFVLYRLGLGVIRVLGHAYTGIRDWFHIGRPAFRQLEFNLEFFS